jgi:hypothetical protein
MSKGYRMFDGRAYLLNGTASGYTPEQAKARASVEADTLRKTGKLVRLIKVLSTLYQIWIH